VAPAPDQPRAFFRDGDGRVSTPKNPAEIAAALANRSGQLWVDIDSTNRHQHALLEKLFRFHALAIEDTLNPNSRIKIESYDDEYLFAVLRVVRFCHDTSDPYDVETTNLSVFIGPNYVVSVHAGAAETVDGVIELVGRSPDLLGRGSARIAYLIADASIDAFFPILDQVDEFIDGLEERVFQRFDESALRDIFSVKRLVLLLRRYLAPQREVFNVLSNRPSPLLPHETQLYFRDVYDHVLRINDSLDTYRELLSSTLDSYLTQVSNRLGLVTKGLSVVATLSVPFVVISGMWGMNFQHIPLSDVPHGFWIMLVLQLGLGIGLLYLLRSRKWL
jgi:magnesium transporter